MGVLARFWNQSFFIPKPGLTEKNLPDQTGRVFIVTGGYTGCGKELAKILYSKNGTVYVAGRSNAKGEAAIEELQKACPNSKGRLAFLHVDLSDLTTIKPAVEEFCKSEERLDVLTNNAGVMMFSPESVPSAQGHDMQLATNLLGPYLLTKLLTPLLEKTAAASGTAPGSVRVTWAASLGVDAASPKGGVVFDEAGSCIPDPKDGQKTYGATKAGNVFLSKEFARRHPVSESGIVTNAWNPGNLKTELGRHASALFVLMIGWMLHPAIYGAYTELWAGWSDESGKAGNNGAYVIPWGRFGTFREDVQAEIGKEGGNARKLWDWCEKCTKEYC